MCLYHRFMNVTYSTSILFYTNDIIFINKIIQKQPLDKLLILVER